MVHKRMHSHGSNSAFRTPTRNSTMVRTPTRPVKRLKSSMRSKTIHPRIKTKLKRKSKKPDPADDLQKGISSFSRRLIINKPHKAGVVRGANMRYTDCISGLTTSIEGLQGVTPITYVGTVSQTMVATNTAGVIGSSGQGLGSLNSPSISTNPVFVSMNPNAETTGSNFYLPNIQPASDKIYLKNVSIMFDVANFGTLDTIVDIYVLKNKVNIPAAKSPSDIWTTCLKNESLGTPDQKFLSFSVTAPTVGSPTPLMPNLRPETNSAFCKIYQTRCVHRIRLGAGAVEIVNFNMALNMLIDCNKLIALNSRSGSWTNTPSSWTSTGQDIDGLKGGVSLLCIQRGTPVFTPLHGITLGPTKLGWNMVRKFDVKYIKGNAARLDTELAFDLNNTSDSLAGQTIVNVVDAVAAVTQTS